MEFGETFFIILGSVLAGLALSLVIIYVITRIQKKPMFPSRKKNQKAVEKILPEPIAILTASKIKSNGQKKESLEELLINHKKPESISVKNEAAKAQSQSLKSDVLKELESTLTKAAASATPAEPKKPEPSKIQKRVEIAGKQTQAQNRAVSKKVEAKPANVIAPVENKREELLRNLKKAEPVITQSPSSKSNILKELESNYAIATAPWASKLTPFQTTFWDSDHLKEEPLLAGHQEEITQVYIDIRLANSIVWLSNEVGHRSADLDQSYKQLCTKIAERLKEVIT